MEKFKETEIKYLAGLLDADGSLSFKFSKSGDNTYIYLIMALSASESVDKHGYVKSLSERAGSVCKIEYEKDSYSTAWKWQVQKRSELDQLLPRLLKHMVIKAKHWNALYLKYTELKGQDVTGFVEELKQFSSNSRLNTGPLKPKNHPTWAWVAGYMDGDGCYTFSRKAIHVGAVAHTMDSCALELLYKAFGGSLYEPQPDNTRLWRHGAGVSQSSFAKMFLNGVVKHSRLKRHKIEQMLHFHNQPQRLNESNATA